MINAEAMVACAAGAITKFKIRMIGIGASANLAAAGIGLYLFLVVYALNLPLEVDGSLALAASAGADIREKLIAAEKQEVENSHDGKEIDGEGDPDNIRDLKREEHKHASLVAVKIMGPDHNDRVWKKDGSGTAV